MQKVEYWLVLLLVSVIAYSILYLLNPFGGF
jgi:hypothetical protein